MLINTGPVYRRWIDALCVSVCQRPSAEDFSWSLDLDKFIIPKAHLIKVMDKCQPHRVEVWEIGEEGKVYWTRLIPTLPKNKFD